MARKSPFQFLGSVGLTGVPLSPTTLGRILPAQPKIDADTLAIALVSACDDLVRGKRPINLTLEVINVGRPLTITREVTACLVGLGELYADRRAGRIQIRFPGALPLAHSMFDPIDGLFGEMLSALRAICPEWSEAEARVADLAPGADAISDFNVELGDLNARLDATSGTADNSQADVAFENLRHRQRWLLEREVPRLQQLMKHLLPTLRNRRAEEKAPFFYALLKLLCADRLHRRVRQSAMKEAAHYKWPEDPFLNYSSVCDLLRVMVGDQLVAYLESTLNGKLIVSEAGRFLAGERDFDLAHYLEPLGRGSAEDGMLVLGEEIDREQIRENDLLFYLTHARLVRVRKPIGAFGMLGYYAFLVQAESGAIFAVLDTAQPNNAIYIFRVADGWDQAAHASKREVRATKGNGLLVARMLHVNEHTTRIDNFLGEN